MRNSVTKDKFLEPLDIKLRSGKTKKKTFPNSSNAYEHGNFTFFIAYQTLYSLSFIFIFLKFKSNILTLHQLYFYELSSSHHVNTTEQLKVQRIKLYKNDSSRNFQISSISRFVFPNILIINLSSFFQLNKIHPYLNI